jgi:GNAT superfamily N-acetyltransferase
MPNQVKIAESGDEIRRCFPVMKQLREKLTPEVFGGLVAKQQGEGYKLAFVESAGAIVAVAGFRVIHMLSSGKTLYVDDLVTDADRRSQGFGDVLLNWLIELARRSNCQTFSLDSGVHRQRAHRFYFVQGLHISDFHFQLTL